MTRDQRRKSIRLPLPLLRELPAIYAEIPVIHCQGKCQSYCCSVGDMVTPFEKDLILARTGKELNGLPFRFVQDEESKTIVRLWDQGRDKDFRCNFLGADGKCGAYEVRPIICRLWGTTEDLPCPHGCHVEKVLTKEEGRELIGTIRLRFKKGYQ